MTVADLDKAIQQLYSAPPGGPSASAIIAVLKQIRDTRSRRSEAVCEFGTQLLQRYAKSLGQDERWLIQEQVIMACLDCKAFDRAHTLIQALITKFPDSKRAERLMGQYFEATGKDEEAVALYERFLTEDPAQPYAHKRLAAMSRSRGNFAAAAEQLAKYSELAPLDAEAWEELVDLYCLAQLHSQASFCCEELLLLSPTNVQYLLRYAEVLYTMGGAENLEHALSYYSAAVQMTGAANIRALYGVCGTAASLAALQGKARPNASVNNGEASLLGELAAKQLVQLYAQQQSSLVPTVKQSLKLLGFSM